MVKVKKLRASFRHALRGLGLAWKQEQSFRLQVVMAGLVFLLMFYFPLSNLERVFLVFASIFVLALELLNSQLETILDMVGIGGNPKIKAVKDLSAAAVLIAILGALLIGLFIFLPYVIK